LVGSGNKQFSAKASYGRHLTLTEDIIYGRKKLNLECFEDVLPLVDLILTARRSPLPVAALTVDSGPVRICIFITITRMILYFEIIM